MPGSDDSKQKSQRKLADEQRADLEGRVEGLRTMGLQSATLAAEVYQDVLDGKVDLADADAEMSERERAA